MSDAEATNRALAHALLRVTFGINIALHGAQRFGHLGGFVAGLVKSFAGVLPGALVAPYAGVLPFAEAAVGVLLIAGFAQRATLVIGSIVMATLTFGSALHAQYDALAQQLGYEGAYFVLLATLTWDRFSLDARGRRSPRP